MEGSWAERKARLRAAVAEADPDAVTVHAADKVAKARKLRLRLVRPEGRSAMHDAKVEHYWASLELLERRLGGHPLVSQLRFELEALALLPPE